MTLIDQPKAIRDGEELDPTTVDEFVRSHIGGVSGELRIKQFPSGASNLTYELQYDNRTFVLRRPPFGTKARGAHDMLREARLIRNLQSAFPYVPDVLAICEDEDVLGAEFYIMERLEGIILRKDIPDELDLSESDTRSLCEGFVDRLIDLHNVDYEEAGLSYLSKGEGYIERQIVGWSKRFRKAQTPDVPDYVGVMNWLHEYMPEEVKLCVIHGDYRFDNCVLDPENPLDIIGVLDWELATIGDPLMDLGNTLSYWVEEGDETQMHLLRRQPTNAPGMMTRQEIIDYYLEKTGIEIESFDFYRIYGLFRVAVIIQQIYYRFYHGQTKDKRFESFGFVVGYIEGVCERLIEQSDL
jgi:aminoglycoside phosphotransferase (APT) family kinase protein